VGRWYVVGYCHLRHDLRAFRLDRILNSEVQASHFEGPSNFDCTEYLSRALGTTALVWDVEVIFKAKLSSSQQKRLEAYGSLEMQPDGWLYRYRTDDLADTAHLLINFRCPFVVLKPFELKTALHELAREIETLAEMTS
jgi:predicted DNA-binding transcriptional regulator YafY